MGLQKHTTLKRTTFLKQPNGMHISVIMFASPEDNTALMSCSQVTIVLFCLDQLLFSDTCHFQKLCEEPQPSQDFDFRWNSVPTNIGTSHKPHLQRSPLAHHQFNDFSLRFSLRHRLHFKLDGNPVDRQRKLGAHHDDAEAPAGRVQERYLLRHDGAGILSKPR